MQCTVKTLVIVQVIVKVIVIVIIKKIIIEIVIVVVIAIIIVIAIVVVVVIVTVTRAFSIAANQECLQTGLARPQEGEPLADDSNKRAISR